MIGPPKTSAGARAVPIPAQVAENLDQHLRRLDLGGEALAFPSAEGEALRMNNWTRRYWKPAMSAAGIDPPITPHQLRHTAVTRWVQEGVDPVTVARRAGHNSAVTILDIYARATEGEVPADNKVSARADAVIAELTRAQRGHGEGTVTNLASQRKAQNKR